ncbi:DUF883 family protein [Nitrococcus mobilis]|uniref:3-ketoacyl-(Acyl-carrier-protein) reductase n=1 Tax=Nitrococcus mobilis Nb-231 TaxID=314278 RepID=A4BTD1_9GAMM|nr:DUF883 family protein [Nitrococcus mobilis]EAR21033.1 3-ketoacyl-(acyl-carrier-protein) reductase [Nitrococcus mobilis Nb-231]
MAATDDLRKELDKLKADLARLRADTSDVTRTLRELGSEKLDDVRGSADEEFQRGRRILRRGVEAGRERGRRALAEVEEDIGAHPYASVFAAVGAGFVLAKLLDIATRR